MELRARVRDAICGALEARPEVLAGWEAGSAAFGALDAYSDIDINFVLAEGAPVEPVFAAAARAIETVAPIAARHVTSPIFDFKQTFYKLAGAGEFFLVDLCLFHTSTPDAFLEVERHGQRIALFDKVDWLRPRPLDKEALAVRQDKRLAELRSWFPMSQGIVRKTILRGRHVEALAFYMSLTLRPLVELLRMRNSPARWDFGLRYLDKDLPPADYERVRDLAFVRDLDDLGTKHARAAAWGAELL
jgi:hypothetical protein